MKATSCLWAVVVSVCACIFGTLRAAGQTATQPANSERSAVVIPAQGPIEWQLAVDRFEKMVNVARAIEPQVIVFQINSPGGVVDYTWHMISEFKNLPKSQTVAWINGEHNGAFSSGAIFALACDKIYMAQGQAIGAAVPFALNDDGIPREVSLKWRSAWNAQVRALCQMKHRPWPVVYALMNSGAGLYKIKTAKGCEYVNYEKIRPMLRPELVKEMDIVVKTQTEELENGTSEHKNITVREGIHFKEGMPKNVEVICHVGEVLTLTAQEAVACGLCDGIADSLEEALKKVDVPAEPRPMILADPFQQSNKQMEGVVRMFRASLLAVGASAETGRGRGYRFRRPDRADAQTVTQCRRIRALLEKYPDLVTSSDVRLKIEAQVTSIEAQIEKAKAQDRRYNRGELPRVGFRVNGR